MNQTEQRLAIAKILGWHWQSWGKKEVQIFPPEGSKPEWKRNDDSGVTSIKWPIGNKTVDEAGAEIVLEASPDYLNDLNAMAEAEKMLTAKQRERYVMNLREIYGAIACDLDLLIAANATWGFATAPQRCEAFLKTLGLWKPSDSTSGVPLQQRVDD